LAARSRRHHASSSSSACFAEHDVATTHLEDGSAAGEATYALMIKRREEVFMGNGRCLAGSDLARLKPI
jgi:hypothetical protein